MTFWKDKIHARNGYRWIYPIHEVLQFQEDRPEIVIYEENIKLNHYPAPKAPETVICPYWNKQYKKCRRMTA